MGSFVIKLMDADFLFFNKNKLLLLRINLLSFSVCFVCPFYCGKVLLTASNLLNISAPRIILSSLIMLCGKWCKNTDNDKSMRKYVGFSDK